MPKMSISGDQATLVYCDEQPLAHKAVSFSIGMNIPGSADPIPDPNCAVSTAEGVIHRIGRLMPKRNQNTVKRFEKFVSQWLVHNIKPLSPDTDLTFNTWIQKTPYKRSRKKQLCEIYTREGDIFARKHRIAKCFVKAESYPEFKYPRGIYSRSDVFKCLVGPTFAAITEQLFAREEFIKKIPIADRPQYIIDRIAKEGYSYFTTDYTSFEAHFDEELMRVGEMQLYRFILSSIKATVIESISTLKDETECLFKLIKLILKAKRLSGEMNTSLGNGFMNDMVLLFIAKELNTEIYHVIEGDDALFRFKNSNLNVSSIEKIFAELGCLIKIEKHRLINTASFCGLVFDTTDKTNVCDVRSAVINFGWLSRTYMHSKKSVHMSLLRAKAMSLAYTYPRCPILTKLAQVTLRLTASYQVNRFNEGIVGNDSYKNAVLIEALSLSKEKFNKLFDDPGHGTRQLVEELYSVSIQQQKLLEESLDTMTTITQLPSVFESLASKHSKINYDAYVYKNNFGVDFYENNCFYKPLRGSHVKISKRVEPKVSKVSRKELPEDYYRISQFIDLAL